MKDNFCITNEYSIIRKGSFTIETACVMPLILLVLMGLIYLSFFVHNRAWLTAAAYESAVSGSMEGIKKNGEIYDTARMRSEELGSIGFFGAENLGTQTNVGKEVQVTYDLDDNLVVWQSELAFEDRREICSDKSGETYPQTAGGAGGTERNGGIE